MTCSAEPPLRVWVGSDSDLEAQAPADFRHPLSYRATHSQWRYSTWGVESGEGWDYRRRPDISFGEVSHVPKLCGGNAFLCGRKRFKKIGNTGNFSKFPNPFG